MISIKELYYTIATPEKTTNPFETAESDRLSDILLDEYIALNGDETEKFSGQVALYECIDYERLTAFEIGFKTAMKLFFEGLLPMASERR